MRWRDARPCVRVLPSLSQRQLPLSDLYSGILMLVMCESYTLHEHRNPFSVTCKTPVWFKDHMKFCNKNINAPSRSTGDMNIY